LNVTPKCSHIRSAVVHKNHKYTQIQFPYRIGTNANQSVSLMKPITQNTLNIDAASTSSAHTLISMQKQRRARKGCDPELIDAALAKNQSYV
jgi:hypothetical protein